MEETVLQVEGQVYPSGDLLNNQIGQGLGELKKRLAWGEGLGEAGPHPKKEYFEKGERRPLSVKGLPKRDPLQ